MSLIEKHATLDANIGLSEASASDYIALLKPRVMSLVVFTGFVGLMAAPGHINPVIAAIAILCIAVGAGASGALNMWYDADIDAVMKRTAKRPIPAGRLWRDAGADFWPATFNFLRFDSWSVCQFAVGVLAGLHDLLLRRRLYDVAEALYTAEHRYWWRGRGFPANDWLGLL